MEQRQGHIVPYLLISFSFFAQVLYYFLKFLSAQLIIK